MSKEELDGLLSEAEKDLARLDARRTELLEWVRLRELIIGRNERKHCTVMYCGRSEYRVKGWVIQKDETRGDTGLFGIHPKGHAVDRSQFCELLKIRIAGQPPLWK